MQSISSHCPDPEVITRFGGLTFRQLFLTQIFCWNCFWLSPRKRRRRRRRRKNRDPQHSLRNPGHPCLCCSHLWDTTRDSSSAGQGDAQITPALDRRCSRNGSIASSISGQYPQSSVGAGRGRCHKHAFYFELVISFVESRLTEGSVLSNPRHSHNPGNERPNPGILIQCFLCKCFWSDIHRCAACVTRDAR